MSVLKRIEPETPASIASCLEKALGGSLSQITRTAYGGDLGRDNNVYTLNVTLITGEKFLISVTKLD